MEPIIRAITSEVADNWPAFLYIAIASGFSICFLRERRAETRILKKMGAGLEECVRLRFDRLEYLVQHSELRPTVAGKSKFLPERVASEVVGLRKT